MSLARIIQRLGFLSSGKEREAMRVKGEMRSRVATLTAQGTGSTALRENLSLLGIDINRNERPQLVAVGGYRFDR